MRPRLGYLEEEVNSRLPSEPGQVTTIPTLLCGSAPDYRSGTKRSKGADMTSINQRMQMAIQFDMSDVLERYAETTRLPPDVLKEHEREIKRFLALASSKPGRYGMRGPLDELWHTFIIFTKKYADFCRVMGVDFIHHLPDRPKASKKEKQKVNNSYVQFLRDYERTFKEEPPAHLWPRPLGDGGRSTDLPGCSKCGNTCSHKCLA